MRKPMRRSGQAVVETIIVMPLFLFILLGLMQLSLLHQARLLTKYAAYKAVRAGALNRADQRAMTNAAIAVMLPMLTQQNPIAAGSGRYQPQYGVYNVSTPMRYVRAFEDVAWARQNMAFGSHPMVDVTVCHPLAFDLTPGRDFDDHRTNPLGANGGWRQFESTKLSIQVTTYLNLYIPYANAILWWASYGELDSQRLATMKMLRMRYDGPKSQNRTRQTFGFQQPYTLAELRQQALNGNYIMPVRGSYSMRMHSNLVEHSGLPFVNRCHVPFFKL